MYLGAQRVRSAGGEEGVNIFGYSHLGSTGIDWRSPDIARIADRTPGRLMFTITQVSAGGNAVLSYLDVAVADEVPARTVVQLLNAAMVAWPHEAPLPVAWSHGSMALGFYVTPSRRDRADAELRELKDALTLAVATAVAPLHGLPPLQARPLRPLRIVRQHGAAGERYALDPESRAFLRHIFPGTLLPESISVTHENKDAFTQFVGGSLEAEVVHVLTRVPVAQLSALAGAVILDEGTGADVWRSPGPQVGG
ncbi:MAG: hypothetical protein Q8S73_40395 [Deltaproteobacteria bacterium]|nr:hypothetical protein [Deltaproteobacteria bacterium]